jgi:hypothetical protein
MLQWYPDCAKDTDGYIQHIRFYHGDGMVHDGRAYFVRKNKQIISFWMILCFAVSYLPVTNSWYLSIKGREDLTRLLASVARTQMAFDREEHAETVSQTMADMFTELKIAAGIIRKDTPPEKGSISLVHIVPEFPVQPLPFKLKVDKKQYDHLFCLSKNYQSVFLPIDTPPPERRTMKSPELYMPAVS